MGATAKGVIQIISGIGVGLIWMVATLLVMTDFNGPLILLIWLALLGIAIWLIVSGVRTLAARAVVKKDTARQESPDSVDKPS